MEGSRTLPPETQERSNVYSFGSETLRCTEYVRRSLFHQSVLTVSPET